VPGHAFRLSSQDMWTAIPSEATKIRKRDVLEPHFGCLAIPWDDS